MVADFTNEGLEIIPLSNYICPEFLARFRNFARLSPLCLKIDRKLQ